MSAFLKTLFGDWRTVSMVTIVMMAEVSFVATGQMASAPFAIPSLVLASAAWLATR